MDKKTCFFIGHHDCSNKIYSELERRTTEHIVEHGATEFIVGNYGNFDRLAAKAVISAKQLNPQIKLFLLLPYNPAERPVETPINFDGTIYPDGMENVPRRIAVVRANRYMVERSDYLIAYAWRAGSNATKLAEYAKSREKKGLIRVTLIECEN